MFYLLSNFGLKLIARKELAHSLLGRNVDGVGTGSDMND